MRGEAGVCRIDKCSMIGDLGYEICNERTQSQCYQEDTRVTRRI
jgi:hypothetical protein